MKSTFNSQGLMDWSMAMLEPKDGWLCWIWVPLADEVTQVKSFFSGNYRCYGVNNQATIDWHCQFTSLSFIWHGGISDSKPFYTSKICNIVSQLPAGFFVVGDNANTMSSTLLIPYSGVSKFNPSRDDFNFFLSHLCIWVEQAFGVLLVMMWLIFKKPMEGWTMLIIVRSCISSP